MDGTILDFLAHCSVILFLITTMILGIIGFFWICKIFIKVVSFFAKSDGTGIVHDEPDIEDRPNSLDELASVAIMVAMDERNIYHMSEVRSLCESDRPLRKEELREAIIEDSATIRWYDLAHEEPQDEDYY